MKMTAMKTIQTVVENVLTARLGGRVHVGAAKTLDGSARSQVVRLRVVSGPKDAPKSVIVKRAPGDENQPYDAGDGTAMSPAWRLFNDWAGAQFLSRLPGGEALCPQFLGGDRAAGLILLEDIGEGESLADVLLGKDAARAEAGLLAFARTLGRMHARTAGRAAEYARLRQSLGPASLDDLSSLAGEVRGGVSAIESAGFALSPQAQAEADAIARAVTEPGPFLAYTHGDPCPDNDRLMDGELKLFDWEFGRFRHALLDGVYGRVPFPTCWCVNRLPSDLPPRMEAAYRAELASGIPQAGDDVLFSRAVAEACAYWMLRTTDWHLSGALKEDGEWGIATLRQRILVRLDSFAAVAEETRHLPALAALAHDLAIRLRAQWPPEADAMPLYPAFRPS